MPEEKPPPARVLYVEDEPFVAKAIAAMLKAEGHDVRIAPTAADFLKSLSESPPDLCLLDVNLPDGSGLDLLRKVEETARGIPSIMLTASDSVDDVVTAMKRGAADYVTKPADERRLAVSVQNALRLAGQRKEIARLRSDVREAYAPEHMVGSSEAMSRLRNLIDRAAPAEATVLVAGQSGTGKELVARALHFSGPRGGGPFVDVNCAALAETLLESEIFGHEKGAFTGAASRRRGRFEQAHGGTIFLDEIGDMPLPTQAKILRVLQERRFQRVGGDERIEVDVRVICATNHDLERNVRKGKFREDLLYRINTLVIDVPPLRSRIPDIPELAGHFLAKACRLEKRRQPEISAAAMETLKRHDWPGNVRELEHAVHRAVLLCDEDEILPEHLPPSVRREPGGEKHKDKPTNLIQSVEQMEHSMILEALKKNGWVKSRAARALGITERMISYKIQNLGIQKPTQ